MATDTTSYVRFNVSELPIGTEGGSDIVGFDPVSRNLQPLVFRGSIGETEGFGQLYGDLLKKEPGQEFATAGDMAALFNVYLSARRGKAQPNPDALLHK